MSESITIPLQLIPADAPLYEHLHKELRNRGVIEEGETVEVHRQYIGGTILYRVKIKGMVHDLMHPLGAEKAAIEHQAIIFARAIQEKAGE